MAYEVTIHVADFKDANDILKQWESEDKYHTYMKDIYVGGSLNRRARRQLYIPSSEAKEDTFRVKIDVPVNEDATLVFLDGMSDAGLPHTRGTSGIAMPVYLLWKMDYNTLHHELVHLSQKQYEDMWWNFYRTAWKFEKATDSQIASIPLEWKQRRRINPDTLRSPFVVWKDRYIALSVFIHEKNPDLRTCKRGFWDLGLQQWTWDPPSGWEELFGKGFNDEHPNEIAAHWIDGSAGNRRLDYKSFLNPVN
jgi:hypothetical protein